MIQILAYPKTIEFAKNPFGFKVNGTNYIIDPGDWSSVVLHKVSGTWAGFEFPDFDSNTKVWITTADTPDDSGTQITTIQGLLQPVEDLKLIPFIAKYFNVSLVNMGIRFDAKEKGALDVQLLNNAPSSCLYYDSTDSINGTNKQVQPNYSIYVQLFVDGIMKTSFELDPDDDGNTEINVQGLISPYFPTPLPTFNQQSISKPEVLKSYYMMIAEQYGTIVSTKRFTKTDVKYVLNGKFDFDKYKDLDLYGDLSQSSKLLTSFHDERNVYFSQQLYFYYIFRSDQASISLKAKVYYTDATSEITTIEIFNSVSRFDSIVFPAGASQLKLDELNYDKEIYKYEVFIDGITTPYSFNLVPEPVNPKQFLFMNQFGVFESIFGEGAQSETINMTKLIGKKTLRNNYLPITGEIEITRNIASMEFEVSLGYKSDDEITLLKELLSNPEFYLVDDDRFIKCYILDDSISLGSDLEGYNPVKFKYRYAHDL